jgi:DNA-binding protein HU-beta
MNKSDLVSVLAVEMKSTKKLAGEMLDVILESIQEGIETDGRVILSGFGSWEVRDRAERNGVNPATGAKIVIPATKTVGFKASKNLKESVKNA